MIVHLDGRLLPLEEARISPMDRGFLFGDGVYEVVRAYRGRWFGMELHEQRLARSMEALGLEGFEASRMAEVAARLVRANQCPDADALLYLQVTRGPDRIRSHLHSPGRPPTVYAMVRPLSGASGPEAPARVATLEDRRWLRCDIKSVALLGNVMAANQARDREADEAILHRRGTVTEGAAVNVAAVIGGVVRTHPESPLILGGISRLAMLEICREQGIPFREEAFGLEELRSASEVFLTGTTREIWPVGAIDGRPLPAPGKEGITPILRREFALRVRSRS